MAAEEKIKSKPQPINLLRALGFDSKSELLESKTAYFYKNVPRVAPEGYLHIVYKPIAPALASPVYDLVAMPEVWRDFLAIQNGAHLFSGAISLHGIHPQGQLLNRRGGLDSRLPFNLVSAGRGGSWLNKELNLVIGFYGFDGSVPCLNREDGSISVYREKDGLVASWDTASLWLMDEIARLSVLFDSDGNCLVDRAETVPNGMRQLQ
jgi:hypothetical protein